MSDPYECGTPKYSTAQDIYDALCEMVETEEMKILSEIGMDVSWESQTYYYTDKGNSLKDKFDKMSDYGDKLWLLDLAIIQMQCLQDDFSDLSVNDLVYTALINADMAKFIGFKKLFVKQMLCGNNKIYVKISEDFACELGELDRFDNYDMIVAFNKVANANEIELHGVSPYPSFAYHLRDKVIGLRLTAGTRLIAECRAHLTAYDDFIFGLKVNQALHEEQERLYKQKVVALQAAYDNNLKQLFAIAERAGVLPTLTAELQQIEAKALPERM